MSVLVVFKNDTLGLQTFVVPGRTVEDMHTEIDDAFVQDSYVYLHINDDKAVYINPSEVALIEVSSV